MNQLTVAQALEQGYEHYLYNSDGYQSLKGIIDAEGNGIDFSRDDLVLADKEPYHPKGMTSEEIADMLADNIEANHQEDSGDDTNSVYDAVKAIDFSDAAAKIQEVLNGLDYYRATNIKLVKG